MTKPKIIAFAGSIRKDSVNKRLARIALKAAEEAGAKVTWVDLVDYQMPLYCQDYETEHGLPDTVIALKELLKSNDGFLIASPEYNGSLTGILKNVIDWTSRPNANEPRMACWNGKIAGLLAASPGGLGGLRGLSHLRTILAGIGTLVLPNHVAVGDSGTNLVDDIKVTDEKLHQSITNLSAELVRVVHRLNE
ncbi:MAG: NAD(P)H-dependent oxidoreductase [Planctomycetota bacterium]|nr:NAD(P)H-dependent oxidoreductase [Planctomycetota bacterium]